MVMAGRDFIVNEALCYLKCKYQKSTVKQLKTVMGSFFTVEELVNAKETLHESGIKITSNIPASDNGNFTCDAAKQPDFPKLVKRTGDGKLKRNLDDLFEIFLWLDERKLLDLLPAYYAENIDRIPPVRLEDVEVYSMAHKMEALEKRFEKFEKLLESGISGLHMSPLGNAASNLEKRSSAETSAQSDPLRSSRVSTVKGDSAIEGTWSDAVGRTAQGALQLGDNVIGDAQATSDSPNEESPFTVVARRKPKIKKQTMDKQDLSKPQRRARICGESASSSLKSGVFIQRKVVFHVDNVDPESTVESVENFLKSGQVDVINCYIAKSWIREHEKVAAFRICVAAKDREKVLDKALWPSGIIVREWKFKTLNKNGL